MESLSTGSRINKASDDAAGLSVRENMTAQINGLNAAVRNANDGISMLQTADGALNEVAEMLQRMRELGTLAQNDTYSTAQRVAMNDEFTQLQAEIDRIAENTQWNSMALLDGTGGQFGGGDVLIPMMYEQYVTRPTTERVKESKRDVLKINSAAFLTGSGIVRAIPGPIFSIASFTGALALEEKGIGGQIIGAVVASIGVFLPSFLIVLFFFPIWQKLKKYALFYRSLEGIYAAVVGIMLGATLYLLKDILFDLGNLSGINIGVYLFVFCTTAIVLVRYKIAPQWVVLGTLLLGAFLTIWPSIF